MKQEPLGYQKIREDLIQSFTSNKLHHALIFSGIKGIGKCSFAKSLAQEITNNYSDIENNPDLLLIQRGFNYKKELKKDITIDEVRKINDFVNLTSSTSKSRVIIIDAVDDLNKNSSNAILKNLEEPRDNIFFFLVGHNEAKILDTIKSRCNIITINTPNYKDFSKIILSNTLEVEDKEVMLLFEISNGSIALALDFYRGNYFDNYQKIIYLLTKKEGDLNVINFINDLLKEDNELMIFERLINLFLSRLIRKSKNNLKGEFFAGEEFLLSEYLQRNKIDNIFRKYDEINNIFLKISSLNLDKKQSLINIFSIL